MSPRGTRTLQRLAELLERHRPGTRIGLRWTRRDVERSREVPGGPGRSREVLGGPGRSWEVLGPSGHGRDVAPGSELKQELHKAPRDQRIIRAECCGYLNIKALSHSWLMDRFLQE